MREFFPKVFFLSKSDTRDPSAPKKQIETSLCLTDVAPKDHEGVRDVQRAVDRPSLLLRQRHRPAHSGDVGVVPCVVVDDDGLDFFF